MDTATVWFVVAVAALAVLVVVLAVFCAVAVVQRGREKRRVECVDSSSRAAWSDLEAGVDKVDSSGSSSKGPVKRPSNGNDPHDHRVLSLELCETLRGLLKEEISRALQNEGISDRLDRLERKDEMSQSLQFASMNDRLDRLEKTLSGALAPPGCMGSPVKPPEAVTAQVAGQVLTPPPRSPPHAPARAPGGGSSPSMALRAAATVEDSPPPREDSEPRVPAQLSFGPTARQLQLADPPETAKYDIVEDKSTKLSLRTIQRQLGKRDAQTTELHRQLRTCQEALWEQTLEARTSSKRLRDLLTDPSRVPLVHGEEVSKLQTALARMSADLASTREQEHQWCAIAKRQRAFFMQSERLASEGLHAIKRHPAGEVFLCPPPVCLEGDEEDLKGAGWNVGTSHVNPYAIDSWPFEPNVLAQRASAEPNLSCLQEDAYQEDASQESGSEAASDEEPSPRDDALLRPNLRLPQPPREGPPGLFNAEPPGTPHPEDAPLAPQTSRSC